MTGDAYWLHELMGDDLRDQGARDLADAAYARALAMRPDAGWIAHKRAELSLPPPPDGLADPITLFVPYYTPRDPERAAELRRCLDLNLDSGIFARIVLLLDDDTIPHRNDDMLQVIRLDHRPGYLDWIEAARRICPGRIALLANSDMHFHHSIRRLGQIFRHDPRAFVALSRFDQQGEQLVPHPNPHWSQDSWAFIPVPDTALRLARRADLPLGVPRCDNRIAYVFATEGYTIYNPFRVIRSVHLHETGLRYYNKTGDRSIIGGMAMVHPGDTLLTPARLAIELWSERNDQIDSIRVNPTLEKWALQEEQDRAAHPAPDAALRVTAPRRDPVTERQDAIANFTPGYIWPNPAFPFRLYLDDPRCRVFFIENLTHNWDWMSAWHQGIRKTDVFFVLVGSFFDQWSVRKGREMIRTLGLDIGNFFILCNEEREIDLFRTEGFSCDLINQNAWLDENGDMTIHALPKLYDAAYVARLIPLKRHELACKIDNLALVAGHDNWSKAKSDAPPHRYLNEVPLSRDKVARVINQSRAGLILSAKEGACYASSEYLLCGVPVVSTQSLGGRHVWYNDTNALIVEDRPEAVAEAVRHFVDNPPDPQVIRQMHIDQAQEYRRRFILVLQAMLDRFDAGDIDAESYFRMNFIEKMRKSHKPDFAALFG